MFIRKYLIDKSIKVLTNEEGVVQGIYYQDSSMKMSFQSYPELLMVDATYKLNNLRMPVFIQLVVDGNGESEVVSVFLVSVEDSETLEPLINTFKEHNPAWTKTTTILIDKDFMERSVYNKAFPSASLQLCLFHVLRSMKREVNTEKMKITLEQRLVTLEILQRIAYSKNEEEYLSNYQQLKEMGIKSIQDYYDHSWHGIRCQWVTGLKESCNFGNDTNNRLESINQKFKQVIERFASFEQFFHDLEVVLKCLRQERDSRLANLIIKRPTIQIDDKSSESQYSTLLTPFAYNIVCRKLVASRNVVINEPTQVTSIITSCGETEITPTTCTCQFHQLNFLPCRHIFALRKSLEMDLYHEESVSSRWLMQQYKDNHHLFNLPECSNSSNIAVTACSTTTSYIDTDAKVQGCLCSSTKISYTSQ